MTSKSSTVFAAAASCPSMKSGCSVPSTWKFTPKQWRKTKRFWEMWRDVISFNGLFKMMVGELFIDFKKRFRLRKKTWNLFLVVWNFRACFEPLCEQTAWKNASLRISAMEHANMFCSFGPGANGSCSKTSMQLWFMHVLSNYGKRPTAMTAMIYQRSYITWWWEDFFPNDTNDHLQGNEVMKFKCEEKDPD